MREIGTRASAPDREVETAPEAHSPPQDPVAAPRHAPLFFWLAAAITVLLDQAAKHWIRSTLPLGGGLPIWAGWMHFTHTLNFGAAWGVLSGQRWLLIIVTFVVIIAIVLLAREFWSHGKLAAAALGLILGGAIGNMIDRVGRGAVTDFIDLDTPVRYLQTFPVFNIADAALTVGVTLLIVLWLFEQLPSGHSSSRV